MQPKRRKWASFAGSTEAISPLPLPPTLGRWASSEMRIRLQRWEAVESATLRGFPAAHAKQWITDSTKICRRYGLTVSIQRAMNADTPIEELLMQALHGDDAALGELLQRYRPLLEAMAKEQLNDAVRQRLGCSDVVQQSCLSAVREFDHFVGDGPGQFVAWLKQIHQRNLQDAARDHLVRDKRAVSRETDGDHRQAVDSQQPTASQIVAGWESNEELKAAIDALPEAQRIAVMMRHLEGKSLAQIAEHLGKSTAATAGLIKRGLAGLRGVLRPKSQ